MHRNAHEISEIVLSYGAEKLLRAAACLRYSVHAVGVLAPRRRRWTQEVVGQRNNLIYTHLQRGFLVFLRLLLLCLLILERVPIVYLYSRRHRRHIFLRGVPDDKPKTPLYRSSFRFLLRRSTLFLLAHFYEVLFVNF